MRALYTLLAVLSLSLFGCFSGRTVYVDSSAPVPLVLAVDDAATDWNRAIGIDYLTVRVIDNPRAGYLSPGSIVVLTRDSGFETSEQNAYTLATGVFTRMAIHSRVADDPSFPLRWLVRHELGHALGLGHTSDDECNVMERWWSDCDETPEINLTARQARRVRFLAGLESLLAP